MIHDQGFLDLQSSLVCLGRSGLTSHAVKLAGLPLTLIEKERCKTKLPSFSCWYSALVISFEFSRFELLHPSLSSYLKSVFQVTLTIYAVMSD